MPSVVLFGGSASEVKTVIVARAYLRHEEPDSRGGHPTTVRSKDAWGLEEEVSPPEDNMMASSVMFPAGLMNQISL